MDLKEILIGSGGALAVLMTLLQVSKLNINPWSWIGRFLKWTAKKIGKAFNGDLTEKIEGVSKKLSDFQSKYEEDKATNCRTQILRFGDEILHGEKHSKEHFDQILLVIGEYEAYCRTHEDFKNNIATATIGRIKSVYAKCMRENNFL